MILDINGGALTSTSSIVARKIPPYDASANTPREAYPLDKIIEKEEWDFVQQESVADDSEKQMFSVALSLLTHLVKFKDKNSTDGLDSAKGHKFRGIIRQKCLSLFKDPVPKKYEKIPIDKANLLIRYVLVLAFMSIISRPIQKTLRKLLGSDSTRTESELGNNTSGRIIKTGSGNTAETARDQSLNWLGECRLI
ncbi:unnamed protein product [Arabidopsis lyrata]|nr:unnamed protein product [Arabidopsis lyrata]